jgi:hypothetical protein
MEQLDAEVASSVMALDRVSLRTLYSAGVRAHLEHHRSHPRGVSLWFGARQQRVVREHVAAADAHLARWLAAVAETAGFVAPHALDEEAELAVRLADRMFEFLLRKERTDSDQDAIVDRFTDMIAGRLEELATPAGIEGISAQEFIAALAVAGAG